MKISIRSSFLFLPLLTFVIPRFWNIIYINTIAIDLYKIYIISLFIFFVFTVRNFKINKYHILIFLIFVIDFISCFYSTDFLKSFFYLINDFLGGYIFFYYGMKSNLLFDYYFSKKIIKYLILIIFSFSLFEFSFSYNFFEEIARNIFGSTIFGEDGTSTFKKSLGRPVSLWTGTSIDLSQAIFGLFFVQYFIYIHKKSNQNFFLVILCIAVIIMAQSRAIIGCLVLFFILNYFFNNNIRSKIKIIGLTVFGLVAYIGYSPDNYIYSSYLQVMGYQSPETSFTGRFLSLITIFSNVDLQFFGEGYGTLSKAFFSENRYDIIGYLLEFIIFDVFYFAQRLVESGILAFVLYIFMYVYFFNKINKILNKKYRHLFLTFLITSFLAMNSTGSVYSFFIYFFIYGNMLIYINQKLLNNEKL